MKKTILKISIYTIGLIAIHVFAAYQAGGQFDDFYGRFINGQHQSMIIGTSRAAQGLCPADFDTILGTDYGKMGNFAFTLANSPYGEVYYKAIQQKVAKTKTNKKRLFIVAVDPWAISSETAEIKNNTPRETNLTLDKVKNVAIEGRPNFGYLMNMYAESWGKIIYNPLPNPTFLHENGWLEVTIPMDAASVAERTKSKIKAYEQNLEIYSLDENRLNYLEKTIIFLKKYGEVYLVRLPVSKPIIALENQLNPNFDNEMNTLANKYQANYISFSDKSNEYQYLDGNHLYKISSKQLSQDIANQISK